MNSCFTCSERFWPITSSEAGTKEWAVFCSPECENADDAKLAEGNEIIRQAGLYNENTDTPSATRSLNQLVEDLKSANPHIGIKFNRVESEE